MDETNFACSSVANGSGNTTKTQSCHSSVGSEDQDLHNDVDGQQIRAGDLSGNDNEIFNVEGKLNPMFIPSIINNVASFLPCTDLKRCRFLNKQWNEECSKYLRRVSIVKLTSKSAMNEFYVQFQENPKLFQNFSFEMLSEGQDTNKFFDKFGLHIKCFKLQFSGERRQLPMKALFYLIFTTLPNLEELSLVGCISDNDHFLPKDRRNASRNSIITNNNNNDINSKSNSTPEETYQGPSTTATTTLPLLKCLEIFLYNSSGKDVSKHHFLIQLLSCVPKMEKISVPKVPRMLSFGMPLLHTLVTTSELHFHNLQHLEMDIALYNGLIEVLKSKRYPLKYLNAEINSAVSEESLHTLLETFGKTLETLQLKFPRSPVASSEFRSASSFQRLKHLTLHGYKGPLNFLEQLRHLESLEIIDNSFAVAMRRDIFPFPLPPLFSYKMIWTHWHEETYAFDCVNSSDVQLLRQFARNFLNLTKLNLPHLNDNDLRVIYQTFSHSLQELTMENSLCTDYGLTGGRPEDLPSENVNNTKRDNKLEKSFIGNLTRLTRLEILTPSIDMTDASIADGIIYCENLKVFILRNAAAITDFGLRAAVDLLQLEKLEMTMCANIRGAGVKYALEKMTERDMTFVWNKYQSRLTSCCINRILNGNSPVTCVVP